MDDMQNTAKIFRALSDVKRIAIINFLQSGSKCACHIAEHLNIGQSALSYQMKILCESGIVECWYEGKWTHYKISEKGSQNALEILKTLTTQAI